MIRLLLLLIAVFDVSFVGAMLYSKHRDRVDREARVNAWYDYWMAESATWDWSNAHDLFETAVFDTAVFDTIDPPVFGSFTDEELRR